MSELRSEIFFSRSLTWATSVATWLVVVVFRASRLFLIDEALFRKDLSWLRLWLWFDDVLDEASVAKLENTESRFANNEPAAEGSPNCDWAWFRLL